MQAVTDHVILRYDKDKDQGNGIIASDVSRERDAKAKVVSVGPDVQGVAEGDTVAFDPGVPRALKVDKEEYLVIKEKYIFAKL